LKSDDDDVTYPLDRNHPVTWSSEWNAEGTSEVEPTENGEEPERLERDSPLDHVVVPEVLHCVALVIRLPSTVELSLFMNAFVGLPLYLELVPSSVKPVVKEVPMPLVGKAVVSISVKTVPFPEKSVVVSFSVK